MRILIAATLLFLLVAASPSSSIGQPLVCNDPVPCTDTAPVVYVELHENANVAMALMLMIVLAATTATFMFVHPPHPTFGRKQMALIDSDDSLARLRESTSDGSLPAFAWPGGYPMYYLTQDGLYVCPACANDPDTSDPVVAGDVNWEGTDLVCEDKGEPIPAAYA